MVAPSTLPSSPSSPSTIRKMAVLNTSSPNKSKKQKHVQFNMDKTVSIDTLSLYDYSDDEHAASWYAQREYNRIVKREKLLIKRLRQQAENSETSKNQRPVTGDFLATHGLESDDTRMQRRIRIKEVVVCVLMEQELHWENDSNPDVERIARTSRTITTNAMISAQERALHQEAAIRKDLLQERVRGKSLSLTLKNKRRQSLQQDGADVAAGSPLPILKPCLSKRENISKEGTSSMLPLKSPCPQRWTTSSPPGGRLTTIHGDRMAREIPSSSLLVPPRR